LPHVCYSRGKITQTLNSIKANITMPLGNSGVQPDFTIFLDFGPDFFM
jgi:hypothetical protein